jgi:hypothetical protein
MKKLIIIAIFLWAGCTIATKKCPLETSNPSKLGTGVKVEEGASNATEEDGKSIIKALELELNRSMKRLKMPDYSPPYFISYTVRDIEDTTINARYGSIYYSETSRARLQYPQVRVGTYKFDSSRSREIGLEFELIDQYDQYLPLNNDIDAIRNRLWLVTDQKYKEALSSYFRKKAKEFDIIHLAMHTSLNDSLPMFSKLAFKQNPGGPLDNDGWLTTSDIYNLKLNARMVVLSACNTGGGQIRDGEGAAGNDIGGDRPRHSAEEAARYHGNLGGSSPDMPEKRHRHVQEELTGGCDEEKGANEEEHMVVRASDYYLAQFGRDGGRKCPNRIGGRKSEHCSVAGGHENDHGFADSPAESEYAGSQNPRHGRGQNHAPGWPAVRLKSRLIGPNDGRAARDRLAQRACVKARWRSQPVSGQAGRRNQAQPRPRLAADRGDGKVG